MEQSQTGEASSEYSSLAGHRVADQYKREGKRKATHTQPVVSISEVSKSSTSNLNKTNRGKGAKGLSSRAKVNQKAISIVGSQPNGMGLSFKTGANPSGSGKDFIGVDGACQGLFVFSSPFGDDKYTEAKYKDTNTTLYKVSNNGGERQNGGFFTKGRSYLWGKKPFGG